MRYKNISDQTLCIPGVGQVEAGKEVESEVAINNPNFEPVAKKPEAKRSEASDANKKAQ